VCCIRHVGADTDRAGAGAAVAAPTAESLRAVNSKCCPDFDLIGAFAASWHHISDISNNNNNIA